jgi:hypothetical protein
MITLLFLLASEIAVLGPHEADSNQIGSGYRSGYQVFAESSGWTESWKRSPWVLTLPSLTGGVFIQYTRAASNPTGDRSLRVVDG